MVNYFCAVRFGFNASAGTEFRISNFELCLLKRMWTGLAPRRSHCNLRHHEIRNLKFPGPAPGDIFAERAHCSQGCLRFQHSVATAPGSDKWPFDPVANCSRFLTSGPLTAPCPVRLLPPEPRRIIHGLLEARRFRPVGSRPLFLLGECFLEGSGGRQFD